MKAKEIAKIFKIGPTTKGGPDRVVFSSNLYARDIPSEIDTIIYGIEWSRNSCRISGTTEMKIRSLSAYGYCKLIADIMADGVKVANDVPRWLNANLAA